MYMMIYVNFLRRALEDGLRGLWKGIATFTSFAGRFLFHYLIHATTLLSFIVIVIASAIYTI